MKAARLISMSAAVILGSGSFSQAMEAAINQRLSAVADRAQSLGLKAGMTAEEVEAILGKPDNRDWNTAWVHDGKSIRIWMCVQNQAAALTSWRDWVTDSRRFGLGFFLVLVNDQLQSPAPSLTSKDAYVLSMLSQNAPRKAARLFPAPIHTLDQP